MPDQRAVRLYGCARPVDAATWSGRRPACRARRITGMGAMKYVTRVLQPGETVVYSTKLFWFIYLRALTLLVIALVILIIGMLSSQENIKIILEIIAGLFAIFAFSAWVQALIRRVTTEFAVTDRRVIYKTGIISRHTIEMNRSRVESVDVNQGLLGRLFGFGTVIVRGTGGTFEPIYMVADPLTFRSHITAG
jgi:membrane protein YdbS with pleckstrin-like domain